MSSILRGLVDPFGVNFTSLGQIMGIVLNVIMGTSFVAGTIALIVSGIQFLMSQGDPKAIDTAQRYLTAGVTAVVISIGALAIKRIVLNIFGGAIGDVPNF